MLNFLQYRHHSFEDICGFNGEAAVNLFDCDNHTHCSNNDALSATSLFGLFLYVFLVIIENYTN